MPNWNLEEYQPIKGIITDYINGLNNRNYQMLANHLHPDCRMAKSTILQGGKQIVDWFSNTFSSDECNSLQFELVDASANFFSDQEAQALLYLQIYKQNQPIQIHIESLYLTKNKGIWQISRIFGLGFDHESHAEYFQPFLK